GEGRVETPLDRPGPCLLRATRIEKAAGSEGEWQSHFTTLTLHVAAADSVGESRGRTRPSTARGGRGATGRQPDADGAGPRGGRANAEVQMPPLMAKPSSWPSRSKSRSICWSSQHAGSAPSAELRRPEPE